jgi:hypothetical protein
MAGHADRICQALPGANLDAAIGPLMIDTLTPLAVEAATAVAAEPGQRADYAGQLRAAVVERARYHADLTRRRYLAVDPANRLVADTGEADWNTALRALNDAKDACGTAQNAATANLAEIQKNRIRTLVTDCPAIWNDPATPQRERKRMTRLLLTDVTVTRNAKTITCNMRWQGGQDRTITLPDPAGLFGGTPRRFQSSGVPVVHDLFCGRLASRPASCLAAEWCGHVDAAAALAGCSRAHCEDGAFVVPSGEPGDADPR